MMTKIKVLKINKSLLIRGTMSFIIIMIAILIGVVISCTSNKKEPYKILKIKANGKSYDLTKTPLGYILNSDSVHSTAMMVSDGDLIVIGDDEGIYYNSNTRVSELNIKHSKPFSYVNGKIYSIQIAKDVDLIPWFRKMKPSDISDLQSLIVSSPIPESYYPYIKEIARVKPHIGLFFEQKFEYRELLKIFKPIFLSGIPISKKDADLMPGLRDLQLLVLVDNDSVDLSPLAFFPKLKQLIIAEPEDQIFPSDYLKNNTQIEKLTFLGKNDFSFIEPLSNLKELSIVRSKKGDKETSIDISKNFKQLEVLNLIGEKCCNLSSLNELPNLRWLTLMINTTQKDFTSIIEHHKNLEMLEVLADSALNLQPLLQLKNLYGLVVVNGKSIDPAFFSMKNLKYLSVSHNVFKDSMKVASLKESLPGCTIVPNDGFCLGSGWLLLLFPLTVMFRVFVRMRKKHRVIHA